MPPYIFSFTKYVDQTYNVARIKARRKVYIIWRRRSKYVYYEPRHNVAFIHSARILYIMPYTGTGRFIIYSASGFMLDVKIQNAFAFIQLFALRGMSVAVNVLRFYRWRGKRDWRTRGWWESYKEKLCGGARNMTIVCIVLGSWLRFDV